MRNQLGERLEEMRERRLCLGYEETVSTPWGFTGRRHLGNLPGLTYFRDRYMDTSTGVFISPDPLAARFALGSSGNPSARISPYSYALDDPTLWLDPMGWIPRNTVVARITAILTILATKGLSTEAGRDAAIELEALVGNLSYEGAELVGRAGVPIQNGIASALGTASNTLALAAGKIPNLYSETLSFIGEIKSGELCNLRWTPQLQAFADWARNEGGTFVLFVKDAAQLAAQNPGFLNQLEMNDVAVMDITEAIEIGSIEGIHAAVNVRRHVNW
jgi:RHS repeat-associated protein